MKYNEHESREQNKTKAQYWTAGSDDVSNTKGPLDIKPASIETTSLMTQGDEKLTEDVHIENTFESPFQKVKRDSENITESQPTVGQIHIEKKPDKPFSGTVNVQSNVKDDTDNNDYNPPMHQLGDGLDGKFESQVGRVQAE